MDLHVFIQINGVVSSVVPMQRGGVTGGTETPTNWNNLLNQGLELLVGEWERKQTGAVLWQPPEAGTVEQVLTLLVWADNSVLVADSWGKMVQQIRDLTVFIKGKNLSWKAADAK
eukprot:1774317-Lingulodinium_polyedra.AAC.1